MLIGFRAACFRILMNNICVKGLHIPLIHTTGMLMVNRLKSGRVSDSKYSAWQGMSNESDARASPIVN